MLPFFLGCPFHSLLSVWFHYKHRYSLVLLLGPSPSPGFFQFFSKAWTTPRTTLLGLGLADSLWGSSMELKSFCPWSCPHPSLAQVEASPEIFPLGQIGKRQGFFRPTSFILASAGQAEVPASMTYAAYNPGHFSPHVTFPCSPLPTQPLGHYMV